MSSSSLSTSDQALHAIVSSAAPATIAEVIARMQAMDAALPATDGLKWFNRLYLMVTEQVDLNPPGGAWQNPQWLLGLDVIFAGYYFAAIRDALNRQPIPPAWSVLWEARFQSGIDRIQFAVAGMNAHIDRDLARALVDSDAVLGREPAPDGPEHADYLAVNGLLATVMPQALTMMATDMLGVAAEDTGRVGQVLALWDIVKARDVAWEFADELRDLSGPLRDAALDAQDAIAEALGRTILTRI